LKIPQKEEKNQNKTSMAKAMDHSEIYRPLFDSPDPRPMY
jgi:hypothetical protein